MMRPDAALRYVHTLRHLRPVQIYGRLWFRLYRPRVDASPPPRLRQQKGPWRPPARRDPSLSAPRTFRLLGLTASLDEIGWDGERPDKLWRYNQHYFDDLNAECHEARSPWHEALVADWIASVPPGIGTGWEPYPLSLRIVNWIKWLLGGGRATPSLLHSLAVQARFLEGRLEHHLLGNHLFANAKALVFAGAFFEGEEAERWLRTGERILARELPEQVLADGAQFELSPMYHALAFEDILDLVNLFTAFGAGSSAAGRLNEELRAIAGPMERWLAAMTHPDGGLSFFNDAAFGVAPETSRLSLYARSLDLPADGRADAGLMEASGYARLTRGPAVVIADVARVGPDYLPGHAHADTLSFELSLAGFRVLVNGGVSLYGADAERLRQRGTPAHNTVTVDGRDSSEVWGGFRVARRARPRDVSAEFDEASSRLSAGHDGYAQGRGGPLHFRSWRLTDAGLEIEDRLEGAYRFAQARLHVHPDVIVEPESDAEGRLVLPNGKCVRWRVSSRHSIESSYWAPRLGERRPITVLTWPIQNGAGRIDLSWE